ncbi:unnamed protein product [Arabis nemorensis]|uniref:Uncharacterized protein n=1 Tax=Arabis nemorensis TaxID=586526 RepID=A0A565CEW2_9BRAS|nr:unnamed protein product [Arabis nemorensis]
MISLSPEVIRAGSQLKKQDIQSSSIPVILVENSRRCHKNDSDEKILSGGFPICSKQSQRSPLMATSRFTLSKDQTQTKEENN